MTQRNGFVEELVDDITDSAKEVAIDFMENPFGAIVAILAAGLVVLLILPK